MQVLFKDFSLLFSFFFFFFSFLRTPASRGTLGLLLPILEVVGFFKFICDDAGNFLNPKYLPCTYFVTSLEVKHQIQEHNFSDKSFEKNCYKHCLKSVLSRSYSGLYSVQMQENMDLNNSEYGHILHSEIFCFFSTKLNK